jgi:hypothetical protein
MKIRRGIKTEKSIYTKMYDIFPFGTTLAVTNVLSLFEGKIEGGKHVPPVCSNE